MTEGVKVTISSAEWFRLKKAADAFEPALVRALRKRVKAAGEVGVAAVKAKLAEPSPTGGGDGKSRDALIAGTRLTLSFSQRSAGVRITTSPSKLDPEHKGFQKVYNKKSFRHPVYGNETTWVTQHGRPYFGAVLQSRALWQNSMEEISAALVDAVEAIGGKVK
jgi:hypothetical protein